MIDSRLLPSNKRDSILLNCFYVFFILYNVFELISLSFL